MKGVAGRDTGSMQDGKQMTGSCPGNVSSILEIRPIRVWSVHQVPSVICIDASMKSEPRWPEENHSPRKAISSVAR